MNSSIPRIGTTRPPFCVENNETLTIPHKKQPHCSNHGSVRDLPQNLSHLSKGNCSDATADIANKVESTRTVNAPHPSMVKPPKGISTAFHNIDECNKLNQKRLSGGVNGKVMPPGFKPGPHDVWCGRGLACKQAEGNHTYREAVMRRLPMYVAATNKRQKGDIITAIVNEIRHLCYKYHQQHNGWLEAGGFVKRSHNGEWVEVGDFLAREKTSQCFRDALSNHYSSSAHSKYQRRRAQLLSMSLNDSSSHHTSTSMTPQTQKSIEVRYRPLVQREEMSEIAMKSLGAKRMGKPSVSHLPPKKRRCRAPEDYDAAVALQHLVCLGQAPPLVASSSGESTPSSQAPLIPIQPEATAIVHAPPAERVHTVNQSTSSIPTTHVFSVGMGTTTRLNDVYVCALQPYLRPPCENPLETVLRIQHQMQLILSNEVVDMFVLPELSPVGYSEHTFAHFLPLNVENQSLYAKIDTMFRETARALGVFICYGTIGYTTGSSEETSARPKLSIRQIVVDRTGLQVAVYDKMNLCDYGVCAETRFFEAGPYSYPVSFEVRTRDGSHPFRFGLLLCADIRYAELSHALTAEHLVDCILQPAAFARDCSFRTWSSFRETRAVENSVYWIGVNYAGVDFGESNIVPPWVDEKNEVIQLGCEQSYLIGRISRDILDRVRATMPFHRKLLEE